MIIIVIKNTNQGFSLIEVLVALLVLTIGLLGLANLQGQSISSSYNAHLRTQATSLASSIVDRMRANREHAMTTNDYKINFADPPPEAGTNCSTGTCEFSEMASFDLKQWKCNLGQYTGDAICLGLVSQKTLPGGEGQIEAEPVSGQTQVTVRWTDTAGEQHQVIMFTSL